MSYSAVVLADSPLAYWRLGETVGTTGAGSVVDASGNSHPGTPTSVTFGTTGLVSGDADTAATFNGTSSKIAIASKLITGVPVTLEAIIKPDALTDGCIIALGSSVNDNDWYRLHFYLPDGKVYADKSTFSDYFSVSSNTSLTLGTKYHVSATFDPTNGITVLINGVVDCTPVSFGSTPSVNQTNIGVLVRSSGPTEWFKGIIDEVAVYDGVLSTARLLVHAGAMTTAAPNAPSALTASIDSTTQATLTWTDNSSDETLFRVQTATENTFATPQEITVPADAVGTVTGSFGFVASTLYYFRIRAENAGGNSAWSSTVSATSPAAGSGTPTLSQRISLSIGIGL